jgi:aminoglycoside phosphotransferase (APT) family kinase protein
MGHVLATAHDMAREHRIISALADSGVPVPSIVGLCEDEEVNGAPFYVMDFVPGLVVRDVAAAEALPVEVRRRMGESLVEVLARLHAVDLDAVGLSGLGRHDGYIERQLKRWRTQFVDATTREIPRVLEVHDLLAARVPTQQGVGIVHGDYRLDNCMMSADGEVAAVLDWELCTLGDVLADVAGMVAYGDSRTTGGVLPPTSVEGFPTTDEVRELYAHHGTRDLADLDFYVAFAYWRITCIVEGVYSRYAAGVMGDQDDPRLVEAFGQRVLDLADLAYESASRLPAVG